MGLYEGRGNLNKQMKDLLMRWQTTKQDWRDNVADEFEKKYLESLEAALRTALSSMDQMAQFLSKIDRDCR